MKPFVAFALLILACGARAQEPTAAPETPGVVSDGQTAAPPSQSPPPAQILAPTEEPAAPTQQPAAISNDSSAPEAAPPTASTLPIPYQPGPVTNVTQVVNTQVINQYTQNIVTNINQDNSVNNYYGDEYNVNTYNNGGDITVNNIDITIVNQALTNLYQFNYQQGNVYQWFYDLQIYSLWITKNTGGGNGGGGSGQPTLAACQRLLCQSWGLESA